MKRENFERVKKVEAEISLREKQINSIRGRVDIRLSPSAGEIPSNIDDILLHSATDLNAMNFVNGVIEKLEGEIDSLLKEMEEL